MVPIKNFCDHIWNSCGFLDPSPALWASFFGEFILKKEKHRCDFITTITILSSTYLTADANKNFGF